MTDSIQRLRKRRTGTGTRRLTLGALFCALALAGPAYAAQPAQKAQPRRPAVAVPAQAGESGLDSLHSYVFSNLNCRVSRADAWFAEKSGPVKPSTNSHFEIKLFLDISGERNGRMNLEPDFDASLHLPNLERRLHLFINNLAPDELPGTDPVERRKEQWFVGARRPFEVFDIEVDTSVGARGEWPPAAFCEIEFRRRCVFGPWYVYPRQSFFWFTDDTGLGAKTSLTVDRWLDEAVIARSISAAKWTQGEQTFQWQQVLMLNWIIDGVVEDQHCSLGTWVTVAGHKNGTGIVDSYRWDMALRLPLYRRWLYAIINPRLEWKNENNWDTEWGMVLGMDFLFWGGKER